MKKEDFDKLVVGMKLVDEMYPKDVGTITSTDPHCDGGIVVVTQFLGDDPHDYEYFDFDAKYLTVVA